MKPTVELIGQDGNIFNLIGIATRALRRERLNKEAQELQSRVFASKSYDNALAIIMEYVEVD